MRCRALTSVALLGCFLALQSTPALAHHKGTYGSHGYVWFAYRFDGAEVRVSSDNCGPTDPSPGAYTKIQASTAGTDEFLSRWPSGISLRPTSCQGGWGFADDISLNYQSNFETTHGNYGGENHSYVASGTWCEMWAMPHRCGYHPSIVHLNKPYFSTKSTAWLERLIMHETSHSLGLSDFCSQDSISNDGTSTCNSGRWTQVMEYKPVDRRAVYDIYPGWVYPHELLGVTCC
jgi:hypothetical protein